MFDKGPRINDPYNTMGTPAAASRRRKTGPLDRLAELSKIKSDFDDAWVTRSNRGRIPQPQLEADLERAMAAQVKEINRLRTLGVPKADIDAVLDQAENNRTT